MIRRVPEHPEIIYRPDLQPPGRRAMFSVITLLAWVIWLYLFLPLLSLGAWWFGIATFREQMLVPGRGEYLLTLTGYAIVVAVTALVIIGWSRYNQLRFGGPDRRQPLPPISDETVARRFGLDVEGLRRAREVQVMEIDFEPDGRLKDVRFTEAG